jgi:hypothetical protein
VISGGVADGDALIGAIGMCKFGGFTFSMPLMSKLVKVPVRRRLVFDFRAMSFLRRAGRVTGFFGLIFAIVFFSAASGVSTPLWLVILAALVFNGMYVYLDTRAFPPPFRVFATQSTMVYHFRDMRYAQEFAALNGEMGDEAIDALERMYGLGPETGDGAGQGAAGVSRGVSHGVGAGR